MARVVVVGGGFAGMATAARLAKLKHDVTLVERSDRLGGALDTVDLDEFSFDLGPNATLLPAVVRDLFRKSGRPLERELDLQPLDLVRSHRFADGTSLDLPGHGRAGQLHAFEALAPGLGLAWVDHVASYGPVWELLRREWFEQAWDPVVSPREVGAVVDARTSLRRRLARDLPDERARLVAGHPATLEGHRLRDVPAWVGLTSYLEQRFGAWTVPTGMAALGEAMASRLATRGVQVLTSTAAVDLRVSGGRLVAVTTAAGDLDADVAVVACDPRRLPALASSVARTVPTTPPALTLLGLDAGRDTWGLEVLDRAQEVVLHPVRRRGATLTLRAGRAPDGATALSVLTRDAAPEDDPVDLLAEHGIDVRAHVVRRTDRSGAELTGHWGGSPSGVLWDGARTARRRLGPRTPVDGVYAAGAHATSGSGLPFAGLTAALVAAAVGPA
ncbi:MAG: phytoene desaturase family protein [Nocardioides sp.]|uniref:phytoene desaturase family protein n=1 Tax=Nocardioides sp. TaxID=35761 RepID=UPI003F0B0326